MMLKNLKRSLFVFIFTFLVVLGCIIPFKQQTFGARLSIDDNYLKDLDGAVIKNSKVTKDNRLIDNIVELFYPNTSDYGNMIFKVIRDMTLGLMVIFIVWAGASLLLNKDSKEVGKAMSSLLYIMLGGVFIFSANRLFGSVLDFQQTQLTTDAAIGGVKTALIGENSVLFRVLSAVKVAAFFLAIIMIVVTGFKVISAGDGEKGKTLIKGLINVVVALLIIKGVDFIYYMAADGNFVDRAADFIINVAKLFAYLYGVVIVIMVIVSGYLYITDGGSGNGFKKASNLLVNILLSALVLFSFLLILYQVFAEFRTGGDAVTEAPGTISFVMNNAKILG